MTPWSRPPPGYQFSVGFLVRWLWTVLVLRRGRNLGVDGLELFAGRDPRPRVEGIERVPASGPWVLAMNHYERPGLRVWWGVSLVTAAVWRHRDGSPPVRWLMTDRFEAFRMGGIRWPDGLMTWLLDRIAWAYGFLLVARPRGDAAPRATVLREARRTLRAGGVLGVTPEAAGGSGPQLAPAWPGSGASLAWLSSGSVPVVPVAFFEDAAGRMIARFGEPFVLDRGLGERAAEVVMGAIAGLLPPELRGHYGHPDGDPRDGAPEASSSA